MVCGPTCGKNTHASPYEGMGGNPMIYIDPDGKDIVYYDSEGNEIHRVKSAIQFITYVEVQQTYKGAILKNNIVSGNKMYFAKAKMPGIIKGAEAPVYQQYDHIIASQTFILNEEIKSGEEIRENDVAENPSNIPELDVNMVKAMLYKETGLGTISGECKTCKTDVMAANYPGDWVPMKKDKFNLDKDAIITPKESIYSGIRMLMFRGIEVKKYPHKKGEYARYYTEWTGGNNWFEAMKKYNGHPKYKDLYQKKVRDYMKSMKKGVSLHYYEGGYDASDERDQEIIYDHEYE